MSALRNCGPLCRLATTTSARHSCEVNLAAAADQSYSVAEDAVLEQGGEAPAECDWARFGGANQARKLAPC